MSSDPTAATRRGELYVIAAPSGAGKTSLMNSALAEFEALKFSVSDTTRAPRGREVDGEHYHFIDRAEFDRRVAAGRYLEHAEVFGNGYGTDRAQVEARWAEGCDVLLEIDVQGAAQVRRHYPQCCQIFVLPPSLDVLEARLRGRGTDQPEVIARRLAEAQTEMRACLDFDWILVNDDFDQARAELIAIIRAWPLRRERQQHEQRVRLSDLLGGSLDGLLD
ncbi:MAG: guanylate kinase [Wenzhouxiangellaceae bacterium]|nr:guanylate kinase [Wenzhouxiangellaceae bacterium]